MLENLIDAILGNLFFVVIIVGGLISFFSDKKKKEEAKENQSKQQMPKSQPLGRQQPEVKRAPIERKTYDKTTRSEQMNQANHKGTQSIDQLREEQLKRLKGTIASSVNNRGKYDSKMNKKSNDLLLERKSSISPKSKGAFMGHLTTKSLADSIVLAEVLGKPRSMKPHDTGQSS